ncbi:carboxypeptidase S [Auriculariales sp. MPI-PUGE-AT-0066]|nr:carboxypeptidase S [Auriculariales sp. MPI-PUGE-AT-0066]
MKDLLDLTLHHESEKPRRPRLASRIMWVALGGLGLLFVLHSTCHHHHRRAPEQSASCPQVEPLIPSDSKVILDQLDGEYDSATFKDTLAQWLSGAVQIPTESYDEMEPIGQDKRWEVFGRLHDYFSTSFPQVHATLTLTKINTYALLYHWQGSDSNLKPLLLTGHQDVVPVEPETVDQWKYPPYSGHYDGDWVYGRGAVDDKSTVISVLATLETLIKTGFKPKRTIVLAFGIDEESSGRQGALQLAGYLEQIYGRDSFAMLVDEGYSYDIKDGVAFAMPATSEKGYLDVHVEVVTPGGHSSIPPPHTGIGVLASLVVALEADPPRPRLQRESAIYDYLQCIATHDIPLLPKSVRKDLVKSTRNKHALKRAERALLADPETRSMLGTTQAVDIIRGGVKVNALPETVKAVVNYRIDVQSSVKELQNHLQSVLKPVAKKFNVTLQTFGNKVEHTDRMVRLNDTWQSALEPAPHTPTGPDAGPYSLLSGTIQAALKRGHSRDDIQRVVVAPNVAGGNTDTQRYWNLTRHIFRYAHINAATDQIGEHTVNEAVRADGLVDYARFFTYLILNADEATNL